MGDHATSRAPGLDFDGFARRLLRHWRGDKDQLALSMELGFKSNTISHWEGGRRTCRASVALRMAEIARPGVLATLADHARPEWEKRIAQCTPNTPEGVALFLGSTMGHRTAVDIAQSMGVSRHVVGRWLRGEAEPPLASFLRFLDVTQAISWVLPILAPDVPLDGMLRGADPTKPVSAAVAVVSLALELSAYVGLPGHDATWLADRCNLTVEQVDQAIRALEGMGAITWTGTHWRLHPSTLTTRGSLVRRPDPDALRVFKAELAAITEDRLPAWEQTMIAAITPQQMRSIVQILGDATSRLKDLFRDNQTEGELLVLRMDVTKLFEAPKSEP